MFATSKNELIAVLNRVFNLEVRIDTKGKEAYQDCVLYVEINTVRAIEKNETDIIYLITGTVFINIEITSCGFGIGLLESRVASFNKEGGLYFAKQEVVRAPFTTLNFEFYSKSLQLRGTGKEIIEDINNNTNNKYE